MKNILCYNCGQFRNETEMIKQKRKKLLCIYCKKIIDKNINRKNNKTKSLKLTRTFEGKNYEILS